MDECYKSPTWQKRRLEAMQYADFRCQLCNAKDKQLHVHHRTYDTFENEPLNDLVVLCEDCHAKFHEKVAESGSGGGAKGCLGRTSLMYRIVGEWVLTPLSMCDRLPDTLIPLEDSHRWADDARLRPMRKTLLDTCPNLTGKQIKAILYALLPEEQILVPEWLRR